MQINVNMSNPAKARIRLGFCLLILFKIKSSGFSIENLFFVFYIFFQVLEYCLSLYHGKYSGYLS